MTTYYRASDGTTFADRAALDVAYDVEGAVPDFSVYGNFFVNASAAARDALKTSLGVRYGSTLHETLDIFHGEPGGPVVIFIHGGYWKQLTSTEFSLVAPGLVERGATVVVPNYALLPTVTIDDITLQMRNAVAWTHANIAEYGGDPNRIVVSGHSAGGHLTAMVLSTDWEQQYGLTTSPVVAGCSISGLFDLRPLSLTTMQLDFRFTPEQILRNSPLLNLPAQAPPLLLTFGLAQPSEFERQSNEYFEAWTRAGLTAELWPREGLNHFDELEAFGDANSELVERLLDLANRA